MDHLFSVSSIPQWRMPSIANGSHIQRCQLWGQIFGKKCQMPIS